MDFIEKWFGLSPDGGDGSLEVLWMAAIIAAAGLILRTVLVRRAAKQANRR
jgi:hypothetical protein